MKIACVLATIVLTFTATVPAALIVGQTDDFQDSTTQGWRSGDPNLNPPSNVADGGPLGAGDAYLQITSIGGGGAGSKLAAFNSAQWTGDYLAAGVSGIQMDVSNPGPNDLTLRLRLDSLGGNVVTVTDILLPSGADWQTVSFDLIPANLTGGDGNVALAGVIKVWLFHNPVAAFPDAPDGPPGIVATLGVDNITAVPALPGDANRNGFVDHIDLAVLLGNWEQDPLIVSTWALGNFTEVSLGDTDVNDADLAVLLANWTGPPPGGAAVPEPVSAVLLLIGAPVAALRRRRR